MKNKILIIIGIIINIYTCRMPMDPVGELTIVKRLDTIDTGGNCLDLDLDIQENVLIAAANYNGYIVYNLLFDNEIITGLDLANSIHISVNEMDPAIGDNRAQSIVLSTKHNIAFILDKEDHIWLYKYDDGAVQYQFPNYLDEKCYGGVWSSVAIDDESDNIGVYTLLKHRAAELQPYCIELINDSYLGSNVGCSAIQEYILDVSDQSNCEEVAGNVWRHPGCQVGDYAEYSTSLVWKNLSDISPSITTVEGLDGEPKCEYVINQGSIANQIYYDEGILTMAYGELGVRVYQKTGIDVCYTENGIIEIGASSLCDDHLFTGTENAGNIDYATCCEATAICPTELINPETDECFSYFLLGHGGKYASAGGIIPRIFSEFDTPGEVKAVFSHENIIFAGLNYSNGCLMAIIDDDNGSVTSTNSFAQGYTINDIHKDPNSQVVALAAGHDGVLIYHLNGFDITFLGKIHTSYANAVKVANNIIFVGTEDGVDIIQIEPTP